MKNYIKYKHELVLGAVGFVLLVTMIWISAWELGFLATNVGKSVSTGNESGDGMNFDLNTAKQLDLKGLAQ